MLFKKYRELIADKNYAVNTAIEEPNRFINGQALFSTYRFGFCTLDEVGCGIIAIYNMLRMFGTPQKLADLIREFETNSTETVPFGFWGINPYSLKKYFNKYCIPYSKINRISKLDKMKIEGGIYLLTYWNNAKKLIAGAHTVALCCIDNEYVVFNLSNRRTSVSKFKNAADIIDDGKLIRGYLVHEELCCDKSMIVTQ